MYLRLQKMSGDFFLLIYLKFRGCEIPMQRLEKIWNDGTFI